MMCESTRGNTTKNASHTVDIPDTLHTCSWRYRERSDLVVLTVTEACWEYVKDITPTSLNYLT